MVKSKFISVFSILLFVLLAPTTFFAQLKVPAPSPNQTIKQAFGLGEIVLEYSRPSTKGRIIFGDLVPYSKIWRTGANSSTKITFSDDVFFQSKGIKAGTYAIYTIPNKDSWDVMLYSDLTLGGYVASYDREKEVLKFNVKSIPLTSKVETFTMNFSNVTSSTATLEIMWENTKIEISIVTEVDSKVMKNIESSVLKDNRPYFQAATYYYENGKDLKQATEWIDKALDANPTAFYMMLLKSKLAYKMNNKSLGKSSAEKTIELATAAKNDDYIALAKKLIEDNSK